SWWRLSWETTSSTGRASTPCCRAACATSTVACSSAIRSTIRRGTESVRPTGKASSSPSRRNRGSPAAIGSSRASTSMTTTWWTSPRTSAPSRVVNWRSPTSTPPTSSRGARLVELGRGFAWLDTGTPASLLAAGQYVRTLEERQGVRVACVEEIALRMGYIDAEYGDYVQTIAAEVEEETS